MATDQNEEVTPTPQAPAAATPNESDIYDRQIRLWGAEAQSKMSSAKVLYVNTTGISSEILKNLVLAGVHASIADGRPYPDAMMHTPSSFLPPLERSSLNDSTSSSTEDNTGEPEAKKLRKMTVAKAMSPHVHELNPLLSTCEINEDDIESIPDSYFKKFDIVIASHVSLQQALRISKACHSDSGDGRSKFYLVHSFGFYSCAIMDLGKRHEFRKEMGKDKLSDVQTLDDGGNYLPLQDMMEIKLKDVKDRWHKNGPPVIYTKYRCILNYLDIQKEWPCQEKEDEFVQLTKAFLKEQGLKEDYIGGENELKNLNMTAMAEVSPVCAVMGGVLGNEVIKAISGRGEPANNILLFDGINSGCSSFTLKKP
mmetsp:Transcript_8480/g.9777  ORF Transcript_8480/g.9777 Transcript_8480/m.9777 type:complete len:368 (+) Transcript_8480:888-1991(+)